MHLTYKQMVEILVDKGHNLEYAKETAKTDFPEMEFGSQYQDVARTYECTICRRWFSQLEWRYHYHPCE